MIFFNYFIYKKSSRLRRKFVLEYFITKIKINLVRRYYKEAEVIYYTDLLRTLKGTSNNFGAYLY
jgi:hypothetical protein